MSTAVLAYAINSLWQVPLVGVVGWAVARMLHAFGPGVKHRVWVATLLLQAVLPACAAPAGLAWLRRFTGWATYPTSGDVAVSFGAGNVSGVLTWHGAALRVLLCVYAVVTAWLLLRLMWRLHRVRDLRQSARPFTQTELFAQSWTCCCQEAGLRHVEAAESSAVRSPVTLGWRRVSLLLPPGMAATLGEQELVAMLAHEAAHIERQDYAKNLLYQMLVLSVAYHPALWWTREQMVESREMVCDAMASAHVGGQKRFAEALLQLALRLAGSRRATVSHAIGIFDAHTLERRIAMLTEGRMEIHGIRRAVRMLGCVMLCLGMCASALALHLQPQVTAGNEPRQVQANVMAGSVVNRVPPIYPPDAKQAKVQGAVVMKAIIGKQGEVQSLSVLSGPEPLRQSATDAVKRWTYKPYLLNGQPTEVSTTITVTYSLGK